jgi:hypothetical protein
MKPPFRPLTRPSGLKIELTKSCCAATCLLSPHCDETETTELLLHDCPHYAAKVWSQTEHSLKKDIAKYSRDYIPDLILTPPEFVYKKPHPSTLLHVKDATTRKILILPLQEIKWDII